MAKKRRIKNVPGKLPDSPPVRANRFLWLIAAAWVLPFLSPYHALPLPDFYTEWLALALGMGGMLCLAQAGAWRDGLWMPRIVLAPVLLGLVLLVQLLLGLCAYTETVLQAGLYLVWVAGLIWTGSMLKKQIGLDVVARGLSWALLLGGLVSAVIGVLQYLHWQDFFGTLIAPFAGGSVYGNLAQANHYANYLSITVVGLGYLFTTRRISGRWAMASGAVLLLAMTLSGSRSTWVYMLMFVAVWRSTEPQGKLLCRATLIALPVFAAIQIAMLYLPDLLMLQSGETTGARLAEIGSAAAPRWFLWQQAWQMFLSAPLSGVGWGEFTWQFFEHFSDIPYRGVITIDPNAHNFVLHLLATTGLPGMLAILVPLVLWVWRAKNLPVSPEKWWLICILAVQFIHGLLEYNLWYAQFLGVAALLLGLGETAEFRFSAIGKKWLAWLWGTALLLGSAQLLAVMQDYRTLEGWVYSGNYFDPHDPADSSRKMQSALLDLQGHSLFRPFVELTHPELLIPVSASPAEKLVLDNRAVRFAPNSELVYRHAMLLASNGEQDAARLQLARAIAVYPADLAVFTQRISVLAARQPVLFGSILQVAQENQERLNAGIPIQTK